MRKFTRYANTTPDDVKTASIAFWYAMRLGATDAGHACAIAARDAFGLTDRQWNGKLGTDVFAATLAMLVMNGDINIKPGDEE